jgi:drug/metabolite transporter (DMT)-like permease
MLTKNRNNIYPIISCLIAATLWGLLWYPIRILDGMGVSGLWASMLIYSATLLPLLPGVYSRRCDLFQQPLIFCLIGISSGWANLGFILAILEGNVVRVLLLFYLSPVWTVLLGKIVLKEQLSNRAWLSILIAMAGAVIMIWKPGLEILLPASEADLLAISAGMAFAIMNVFIRMSGDRPLVLKMGMTCVGVLLFSAGGILLIQPALPNLTLTSISLAVCLGTFGMLAMTFTAQYGVTHLPVHRSAVIFLFEIIAGAVSAALLTDEIITNREWCGGTLVIAAAWLTAHDNLKTTTWYYRRKN